MAETVIVGCKLPQGLVLQVGDKRVRLRGSACYIQPNPKRKFQNPRPEDMVLADTVNLVDKDFWEKWKKQVGRDYAPIKSGAIYEAKTKADIAAMAVDLESVVSGFEKTDPDKAPGIVKASEDSGPAGLRL